MGCATAEELASRGIDVLLLERHQIAHGASGRNHGLIFHPQSAVTDPLYRVSREMYRGLDDGSEVNVAIDERPQGFIILVKNEDEWAPAEAEAAECERAGVRVERLDESQLRHAEPGLAPEFVGGWFIDDGYRLDPAALCLAFALRARDRGADVMTGVEVKQVLVKEGRAHGVATDHGIVRAKTVVNAAGPWAWKLAMSAGADLRISGARGWLLMTRALQPVCNHLLESSGWHLISGDPGPGEVKVNDYAGEGFPGKPNVGLLIQQNATGHVLMGGSRLAALREDPEGHEVTKQIARRAVGTVPELAGAPLAAVWSGVRPVTPDGLPYIGWSPGIDGLLVVTGHGGQGIIMGGGTGRLAAQLVSGEEPFVDPAPFDPGRNLP